MQAELAGKGDYDAVKQELRYGRWGTVPIGDQHTVVKFNYGTN